MSITREQVADLREGDVVELSSHSWPEGTVLRGPLRRIQDGSLYVGNTPLRYTRGEPLGFVNITGHSPWSLTVISRAPRPLYVNHDRTEPVPGDVVRDADGVTWLRDTWKTWHSPDSTCGAEHQDTGLVHPLNLLVDGETGQVVP